MGIVERPSFASCLAAFSALQVVATQQHGHLLPDEALCDFKSHAFIRTGYQSDFLSIGGVALARVIAGTARP
jgi:hypothetical protein